MISKTCANAVEVLEKLRAETIVHKCLTIEEGLRRNRRAKRD